MNKSGLDIVNEHIDNAYSHIIFSKDTKHIFDDIKLEELEILKEELEVLNIISDFIEYEEDGNCEYIKFVISNDKDIYDKYFDKVKEFVKRVQQCEK